MWCAGAVLIKGSICSFKKIEVKSFTKEEMFHLAKFVCVRICLLIYVEAPSCPSITNPEYERPGANPPQLLPCNA